MEIFVSEVPKDCSECPMCRSGNLKLQRKGRYIEVEQCVFGQYKYQTIDDEIDTCPLKSLSDRLAEERKKVMQEIRTKISDGLYQNSYGETFIDGDIYKILNQIEENLSNKN